VAGNQVRTLVSRRLSPPLLRCKTDTLDVCLTRAIPITAIFALGVLQAIDT